MLADDLGGVPTRLNQPMDVVTNAGDMMVGVEVKGLMDNKNAKLTIHPPAPDDPIGARMRKIIWAKDNPEHGVVTVAFRAPPIEGKTEEERSRNARRHNGKGWKFWVRAGVGSFELKTMTELGSLKEVRDWIRKNRAAIAAETKKLRETPVTLWGGLLRREIAQSKAAYEKVLKETANLPSKERAARRAQWTENRLRELAKMGRCRFSGKLHRPLVDWNGKPVK